MIADLVVDSSVAIKWFTVEPHAAEARQILDDYQTGLISFVAPDLIYAEVGNIVWKKLFQQGLAADDAQAIITEFRKINIRVTTAEVLLEDAYKLAVKHQRTVYDSLYVALSLREQCQFVIADERLVNAIGSSYPNVIWLPKWR
jgi:predicted nucleic acid-binding protein